MEDLSAQTHVAHQLAGLLEQAQEEGRLDEELAFWTAFMQKVVEFYQHENLSSQTTIPSNALELPECPQAIKAPTGDGLRGSKRKVGFSSYKLIKTPALSHFLTDHTTKDGQIRKIHPPGQRDEPATKRAKKIQSTFTTRAAGYQEHGDIHQGLLGQASQWGSVVSKVCEELGGRTTDQAGQASGPRESVQAAMENQVLYFCRVFGKPGRQRLRDILRTVRQHQSEGELIIDQAETQYGLKNGSRSLREWITSIQQQDQARKAELGKPFQRYLLSAQQYEKWIALLQAAEDPRSETSTKMYALGLTTSQGRDVRTNVKAYFLNVTRGFDIREAAAKVVDAKNPELIKARNSLQNTIATGRTYYVLQEVFGPGVFLLLPEQAPGYFRNNWSKASLNVIVHAVAAVIPDTKLYCARLFDLILKPLQDGRVILPLKIDAGKARYGQGLLEMLQPQDTGRVSGADPALSMDEEGPRAIAQNVAGVTITDSLSTPGTEEGKWQVEDKNTKIE